jgi:hypothetical protein
VVGGDVRYLSRERRRCRRQGLHSPHPSILTPPQKTYLTARAELHELRVKAEKDKEEEASLIKSMAKIEATAQAQFEADQAAAEAAKAALGEWVSRPFECGARDTDFEGGRLKRRDHHPGTAVKTLMRFLGLAWPWAGLEAPGRRVFLPLSVCAGSALTPCLVTFFIPALPPPSYQETDESGYFYNAVQRYYYNKCAEGAGEGGVKRGGAGKVRRERAGVALMSVRPSPHGRVSLVLSFDENVAPSRC